MKYNTKKYPAKVLLFGEYAIIKNGIALAFPLKEYSGSWAFNPKKDNSILEEWIEYIDAIQTNKRVSFSIDCQRFRKDLAKGLYFDSNIPMGYGVGSSGALCAALYDEYSVRNQKILPKNDTIFTLKAIFQTLENFFHGSSSGIDPLVCYYNQPILIRGKTDARLISFKKSLKKETTVFLLNTHQPRQTEPLVQFFLEQLKEESFETIFEQNWCLFNEILVEAFHNQDYVSFFEALQKISEIQFKYLPPMIPKGFETIWAESLKTTSFKIKLCGAGGGGFLLGFTKNWEKTKTILTGQEIIKILDF